MTKLYINTEEEMTPGEIAVGTVWVPDEGHRRTAVKCIRSCSKEEYLSFVERNKLSHYVRRNIHSLHLRFYVIEVLD